MKKVFSLLLALMIVFSMAMPAYATGGTLTINRRDSFTCSPGIATATDLFDEQFKGVMPGDTITGYVTINSGFAFNEDSIKVYMRAMTHTATDNVPVVEGVEDVDHMNEFLNQLSLRVYNESRNGVQIFEGKANELDGLKENVYLGSFRKGGKIQLRVELDVPIEMGNEFANDIGEVDWVFTVEAYDDPTVDNPKTGDYIMMAVAVMAVSAVALVVILAAKRKKKK